MEKLAVQRIVRDANGKMRIILIDLDTLQPITDPTGYHVINQHSQHIEQVTDVSQPDAPEAPTAPVAQGTAPAQEDVFNHGERGPIDQGKFPGRPGVSQGSSAPTSRGQVGPTGSPSLGAPQGSTRASASHNQVMPELDYERFSPPSTRQVSGFEYAGANTAPREESRQAATSLGFVGRPDTPSIDYSNVGPNRPHRANEETEGFAKSVAEGVLGKGAGVSITSGDVNPEDAGWTAEDGKYSRSRRHTDEEAVDAQFRDPQGNMVTDPVAMQDLAMEAARQNVGGIGFGPDYMGNQTMHLDTTGRKQAWGGMPAQMAENVAFARATGIGPTPYKDAPTPFGPDQTNPNNLRAGALDTQPDFNADMGSVAVSPDSISGQIIDKAKSVTTSPTQSFSGNVADMSPAEFAAKGFAAPRTAEEDDMMARAIAGEISPSTYAKAAAGNPEALEHIGNVVASIENRAASKQFGSLMGALAPSQYNALSPENMATTKGNFAQWGSQIKGWMGQFRTGALQPTNYGITNYYNPQEAQPGWGPQMSGPVSILDHKFGSLPGYEPNESFLAERQRVADAQVSDTRGFSPTDMTRGSSQTAARSQGYSSAHAAERERDQSIGGSGFASGSAHSQERERDTSLDRGGSGGFGGRGGSSSGTPGGGNQGTSGRGGMTDNRGGSVSAENAGRGSSRSSSHSQERERDNSARDRSGSESRGGASAGGRNRGEY